MTLTRCRRILSAGIAFAVIGSATQGSARPLEEEISQLLINHPQIREAKNLLKSAGFEVDRAFAPYLPSVNLTANKGLEYVDSPSRRENEQAPSILSNEQTTLELSYNLFDGFGKDAGYRIAETGEEIARLNFENTRQSILFVGIRTYWQLRLAHKQLEIDRLAERTAQEQLEGVTATEGAQSTELDTIRAKGRYYAARSARITSENQVTDLESEYERVFGHRPIESAMEDLPDISLKLPKSLEESLDVALTENPGFKSSRQEIVRADETVRQAEATYFPNVSIVGTANWENNLDATRGIARDLNVVVRGTWQLFDGFATDSGVKSATAQRAAAKNRNRFTYRQVVQDVTRTWNQIELNRNQVLVWEDSVRNAEAAIDGLESLVEQGRETSLAVLDGKIELFNTKRQLNQFTGLKELSQYRLLLILGWLTPEVFEDAAAPAISPLLNLPETGVDRVQDPARDPAVDEGPSLFREPGSTAPPITNAVAKAHASPLANPGKSDAANESGAALPNQFFGLSGETSILSDEVTFESE